MKHEPTKSEYYKIVMDLIYFYQRVERIFTREDLKKMDELIYTIRWYSQFTKE